MDPIITNAIQQQQQQVAMQTQMSVLKTTMNVQKELGQAIVGLIESAANLQMPGKAVGLGANFDMFA
ncbi:MAG: putative motility protein [Thermoguttaceae bacterium]